MADYNEQVVSGKTTNLIALNDRISPALKGEIMTLETQNDRTLFFGLLPIGFTVPSGLLIKLKLLTVPGQVPHDSTRKAVLSHANGVVFVADSQRSQSINNSESFENLAADLQSKGVKATFDTQQQVYDKLERFYLSIRLSLRSVMPAE